MLSLRSRLVGIWIPDISFRLGAVEGMSLGLVIEGRGPAKTSSRSCPCSPCAVSRGRTGQCRGGRARGSVGATRIPGAAGAARASTRRAGALVACPDEQEILPACEISRKGTPHGNPQAAVKIEGEWVSRAGFFYFREAFL